MMSESRKLDVVVANPITKEAQVVPVTHGEDVAGMDIVAVIDGKVCVMGCAWCLALRRRIQSRTR